MCDTVCSALCYDCAVQTTYGTVNTDSTARQFVGVHSRGVKERLLVHLAVNNSIMSSTANRYWYSEGGGALLDPSKCHYLLSTAKKTRVKKLKYKKPSMLNCPNADEPCSEETLSNYVLGCLSLLSKILRY